MTLFDIEYDDFKREDTTNVIAITLYTDDKQPITPNSSHTWKAKVSKEDKYVGEYPVTISGNTIKLSSSNLTRLPNGDYGLELWETYDGSTTIYPSAGVMEFRVHRNANDTLGTIDPTTDINAIIDDLHKAGQNVKVVATNTLSPGSKASVTQSITNGENQLTFYIPQGDKGDKGDVGPAPTLKIGTVTKLGPDQAPTANLSGGNGVYTLNMGIPQGVQGETNETATNALNLANSANDKYNNMQIGGRNLVFGTAEPYVMGFGIPATTWQDGYAYLKLPTTLTYSDVEVLPQDPHTFFYNLTPGQEYTQTVWFETDATVKDLSVVQTTWYTSGGDGHDWQPATLIRLGENKYKLYSTYTWPGKRDNNVRLFDLENLDGAFDLSTGTYLKFGKLKLEEGNVSTDWTPAPEDVDANTDTKISDLQIGGTNLLKDTDKMTNTNYWGLRGGGSVRAMYGSLRAKETGVSLSDYNAKCTDGAPYIDYIPQVSFEQGTDYTVSFWTNPSLDAPLLYLNADDGGNHQHGNCQQNIPLQASGRTYNGWYQVTATFKPKVATAYLTFAVSTAWASSFKLEKGNKATDWQPAPEDIQSEIDALKEAVKKLGGTI